MNNLGYVIIEFSSVDEAKGCLFGMSLSRPELMAQLQEDNTHLHADPFYFYSKLKKVD